MARLLLRPLLRCLFLVFLAVRAEREGRFFHIPSPLSMTKTPPTPAPDSTHLLGAVLLLGSQVHALTPVSLALFVVGFLAVGVVSLAVAQASHGAGEPLL